MKNFISSLILLFSLSVSAAPPYTAVLLQSNRLTPTIQKFTTSGACTYNTPAGVTHLRVRLVGAGGGGGGSGTASASNGTAGGDTIFGPFTAGGGSGSALSTQSTAGAPGTGGTVTGSPSLASFPGGDGQCGPIVTNSAPSSNQSGGAGGMNAFFGGGGVNKQNTAGGAAKANSGGGGSGAGGNASVYPACGGGAGAAIETIITNPSSSYSCSVGAKGAGGSAGTSGLAGGNGADGYIEVTEYYGGGPVVVPITRVATSVKTSAYTALVTDDIVQGDTTSGAFTITLPSAVTAGIGKVVRIIKVDSSSNLLSVTGTIGGGSVTTKLHLKGENIAFFSDGSSWQWMSDPTRTLRARVTTGASFTVNSQDGAWLTASSSAGTGKAAFSIPAGLFNSSSISCVCNANLGAASMCDAPATSTTTVTVWTYTNLGALSDESNASLLCTGLR